MRTDETQRSENVRVAVVVAHEASELEHFAAEQLCNYLQQLFRVQTSPTHNIPSDAEALLLISRIDLLSAAERERFARVSKQMPTLLKIVFVKSQVESDITAHPRC